MSTTPREELAARSLHGSLSASEQAELDRHAREDPVFARELASARAADREWRETTQWLHAQPSFTLSPEAVTRVRADAAGRARRPIRVGLWIGAMAAGGLALAAFFLRPSPSDFDPNLAKQGQEIVQRAVALNPATRTGVWQPERTEVRACLWIVEEDWDALSTAEQDAVANYLKSSIPAMRQSPDQYLPAAIVDTAERDRAAANVANMQPGAFIIFTLVRRDNQWVRGRTAASS